MKENSALEASPSEWLVKNLALLPRGRALDVAMGFGRNAFYLAENGFQVEGVDISVEAVAYVREQTAVSGLDIAVVAADLEADFHIESGRYDVIICFNYLQRSLISEIKKGLRKGGMVVYETFIVEQAQFGRPKNPDHLLKNNELLDMFRDFRCLRYREGIIDDSKAVAGIVAEKITD